MLLTHLNFHGHVILARLTIPLRRGVRVVVVLMLPLEYNRLALIYTNNTNRASRIASRLKWVVLWSNLLVVEVSKERDLDIVSTRDVRHP
jgi:hypothetical protein